VVIDGIKKYMRPDNDTQDYTRIKDTLTIKIDEYI